MARLDPSVKKRTVPVLFVVNSDMPSSSFRKAGFIFSYLLQYLYLISKKEDLPVKPLLLTDDSAAPRNDRCPPDLHNVSLPTFRDALRILNRELRSGEMFSDVDTSFSFPLICFITSQLPHRLTPNAEWFGDNRYYSAASKLAIAIGDVDDYIPFFKLVDGAENVSPLKHFTNLEILHCRKQFYTHLKEAARSTSHTFKSRRNATPSADAVSTDWVELRHAPKVKETPEARRGLASPFGALGLFPSAGFGLLGALFRRKNTHVSCSASVKTLPEDAAGIHLDRVQFSAIVPQRIIKGNYAMIDVSVYEENCREIVDAIIANTVEDVREIHGSAHDIAANTAITVKLSSPDLTLTDNEETQKWASRYALFSFPVEIPQSYSKEQVLFIAAVYFNGVIATRLKFIVNCDGHHPNKLVREDVHSAFISYASKDRNRVATVIQGMRKVRPDLDLFFDVESLRSGEDWEKALSREIDSRDVLYLCWSQSAKESQWVEKEWRYALKTKGLDAIEPIPLTSPSLCPPPTELQSKHFNDKTLFYIVEQPDK